MRWNRPGPGGEGFARAGTLVVLRWHLLLVPILAVASWIYWPALSAGYVWDDEQLFVLNASLRSGNFDWKTLSQPVLPGSGYFRPVVLLSFLTEFRLMGAAPAVSHAVNLSLLLLNVSLVYWLAFGIALRAGFEAPNVRAALATAIYAVHPVLVEPAAWISGRFDLMLATFGLLALCAEVHIHGRAVRAALVPLFFGAALGCKETAVVLPPCLLLARLTYDRNSDETLFKAAIRMLRNEWRLVLALGVVFAAYLFLKTRAVGMIPVIGQPAGVDPTFASHVLLVLNTATFYAKASVFPFGMVSPLNPLEVHNVLSATNVAIGAAAIAGLATAAKIALKGDAAGPMFMAGFVAVLPVLNIVPLSITDNIGHYRFLALPLCLFCIAAALIRLDGTRMISRETWGVLKIGLVAAWVAGALATSKSIVPLWNNSDSLWSWTYTQHPESRMAGAQYAAAALRKNRPETARKALEDIRARHGGFTFHEQLFYAECLLRADNLEEATKYLRGITDALPQYHAWPDSAAARRELQTTSAAEVLASAFWHLAVASAVDGRGDDARRFARIAIWYQPGNPQLMTAGALFMQRFGQPDEAERMRREVREMVGSSALPAIDDAVRQSLMSYSSLAVWFKKSATAPEGGT